MCSARHSLLLFDDSLLLFGGLTYNTTGEIYSLNDLWLYDIAMDQWRALHAADCISGKGPDCTEFHAAAIARARQPYMPLEKQDDSNEDDRFSFPSRSSSFPVLAPSSPLSVSSATDTLLFFGGRSIRTGYLQLSNNLWALARQPAIKAATLLPLSPGAGGLLVTIHGENLNYQEILLHCSVAAAATTDAQLIAPVSSLCTAIAYTDPNTVTCITPAGVGALVFMHVYVFASTWIPAAPAIVFGYQRPRITQLEYNDTSTDGGGTMIVHGLHFGAADTAHRLSVFVGSQQCTSVTFLAATRVSCLLPPGFGRGHAVRFLAHDQVSDVTPVTYISYASPVIVAASLPTNAAFLHGQRAINVTIINAGQNRERTSSRKKTRKRQQSATTKLDKEQSWENLVAPITTADNSNADDSDDEVHRMDVSLAVNADVAVWVGPRRCVISRWWSLKTLQCVIPAGAGMDLPLVAVVAGQSSTNNSDFRFSYPRPLLLRVIPAQLPTYGGALTLMGRGFGDASNADTITVIVGGQQCGIGKRMHGERSGVKLMHC